MNTPKAAPVAVEAVALGEQGQNPVHPANAGSGVMQGGEVRQDGMPASQTERQLRRMLCVQRHGFRAYMDDGEASWGGDAYQRPTDYMRESPERIESAWQEAGMKKLAITPQDAAPAVAVEAVPEGYAQRVIEELYENGDPVSVDAAELLTQMIAAPSVVQPTPMQKLADLNHDLGLDSVHLDSGVGGGVTQWQPIETAPKDGAYFLAGNAHGTWVCHHQPVAGSGYRFDNPWRSVMLNHWHIEPRSVQYEPATHWMPLPPPPARGDVLATSQIKEPVPGILPVKESDHG